MYFKNFTIFLFHLKLYKIARIFSYASKLKYNFIEIELYCNRILYL